MAFKIESVHLNDVTVVVPEVRGDSRGFFYGDVPRRPVS